MSEAAIVLRKRRSQNWLVVDVRNDGTASAYSFITKEEALRSLEDVGPKEDQKSYLLELNKELVASLIWDGREVEYEDEPECDSELLERQKASFGNAQQRSGHFVPGPGDGNS